ARGPNVVSPQDHLDIVPGLWPSSTSGHVRHRGRGPVHPRGEAAAMRDDSPTADLVLRARKGDSDAWDALVERFAPLIWSICHRYSLGRADAEDIGQYVWLRLVDQLDAVHDPAALPGWLATTTQRECLRALRAARTQHACWYEPDVETIPDEQTGMAEHEVLLAERHAAL